MKTEFKFPDVGEGIIEGEIVQWRVSVGDAIEEDQVLVEVETDKAVVELPAPREGVVLQLHHEAGDVVNVGEVLVTIGGPEDLETSQPRKDAGTVVGVLEEAPSEDVRSPSKVLAMPAVRKMAEELGIDLDSVRGTGPQGNVTAQDLKAFAAQQVGGRGDRDALGEIVRVPLRGIRRTIAKNMPVYQHAAAHVTHMDDADVTELSRIKEKEETILQEKEIKLTMLSFVIKAVVIGLKEYPFMNATLDEEQGEIVLMKYYNIGIAVDTEDGLMVPVIKDAEKKNVMRLAEEIERLGKAARARSIALQDLKGGTFSITNVGAYGGIYATPIIHYPQAAILATGRIQERPAVVQGKITVREILPLSLTFDHRIMDGAMVAGFVKTVIRHLEDPGLLLLELQ